MTKIVMTDPSLGPGDHRPYPRASEHAKFFGVYNDDRRVELSREFVLGLEVSTEQDLLVMVIETEGRAGVRRVAIPASMILEIGRKAFGDRLLE